MKRLTAISVLCLLLAGCMTESEKISLCAAFATDTSSTGPWSVLRVPPELEDALGPLNLQSEVAAIYGGRNVDSLWLKASSGEYALCQVEQDLRVVAGLAVFAKDDLEVPTTSVITSCHWGAQGGLLGWLQAKLQR